MTRLLSELGRQEVPALVLDFHRQFAEEDGSFVKAGHPHVLDAAKGLPFSPFECTSEVGQGGWEANALTVSEIFAYVAGLGEMQKDVVYTAIRDAYKTRGFGSEADPSGLEYPCTGYLARLFQHLPYMLIILSRRGERIRPIS